MDAGSKRVAEKNMMRIDVPLFFIFWVWNQMSWLRLSLRVMRSFWVLLRPQRMGDPDSELVERLAQNR